MNYKQKESNVREVIGCAKIARYERKMGRIEEAQKWEESIAKRLQKLNGMAGNW